MDGESARLRARRIEAGRRAVAGAANGGDSAQLGSCEVEERERLRWTGSFEACVREEKSGAQARLPTRGAAPTSTVAGMAGELHSAEQEMHCFFV